MRPPRLLPLLAIAACAAPSERIATALTRYGLDRDRAACAGERLAADLSTGQLRQLGRAARAYREGDASPGRLTVDDLVRVAGEIEDPEVVVGVTRAGVACGVLAP